MAWKEKESAFVKFEKPGQTVEGFYAGHDTIVVNDAETFRHSLINGAGVKESFLGTTQIDQLLGDVAKGTMIKLEFTGSRALKAGRTFKDFRLSIDAEASEAAF